MHSDEVVITLAAADFSIADTDIFRPGIYNDRKIYRTTSGKSSREGPEWESERAEWVTRDREPTGPTRPGRLGTVREERIVGVNE